MKKKVTEIHSLLITHQKDSMFSSPLERIVIGSNTIGQSIWFLNSMNFSSEFFRGFIHLVNSFAHFSFYPLLEAEKNYMH